ncbi:uncharacterized protein RSE6_09206 [Rhynchosporium secalis]|uniref:Uncharacterized protein n=1 Tax=Rhynchosporium secalis TaxID=38038 RepID=A0A1E1MHF8_RHYSE|nr:uncharacterized protein RSE6_09206 [Rhynchosporium secalis]
MSRMKHWSIFMVDTCRQTSKQKSVKIILPRIATEVHSDFDIFRSKLPVNPNQSLGDKRKPSIDIDKSQSHLRCQAGSQPIRYLHQRDRCRYERRMRIKPSPVPTRTVEVVRKGFLCSEAGKGGFLLHFIGCDLDKAVQEAQYNKDFDVQRKK